MSAVEHAIGKEEYEVLVRCLRMGSASVYCDSLRGVNFWNNILVSFVQPY